MIVDFDHRWAFHYLAISKETCVVSFKSTVQKRLSHQLIQLFLSNKFGVLGITWPNRVVVNKLIFHSRIRSDNSLVFLHRYALLYIRVILFSGESEKKYNGTCKLYWLIVKVGVINTLQWKQSILWVLYKGEEGKGITREKSWVRNSVYEKTGNGGN